MTNVSVMFCNHTRTLAGRLFICNRTAHTDNKHQMIRKDRSRVRGLKASR